MPARDIREPYFFSLTISSRLDFEERKQPDPVEWREKAKSFSGRIGKLVSEEFRGMAEVRVEYARTGSAYAGHSVDLHLESREEWERACRVFSEFTDDWEDLVADQWTIQEHLARSRVRVRISAQTANRRHAASPPPPPNGPTAEELLRRDQKRVRKAMRSERRRTRRLLFNMGWAALAFGLVASAAAWNYWFLNDQVKLLREELASRAASSAVVAPPPSVVVTCPPADVRVIQSPPVRQSRIYRTR